MKNFSKFLICVCLSLLSTSCSEDYLEVSPTTDIASIDAFSTTTNAWAAINGIHRSLYIQYYDNQDQGGQGSNMIYVDLLGEDVVFTSNNVWFRGTYRWVDPRNATDKIPYFNYRFYYTIISNANMIIDNVDNAEGPEADKAAIKGQALAYRAWSYYQMVRLFGERFDATSANDNPGVPLILDSSINTPQPRATVAEVYNQINADLDQAISLFEASQDRPNKSHLGLSVAQGFKARVALTQENWELAATMANAARQDYPLMSRSEILEGFNDYNNPEWMWGSHQNAEQNTAFFSFFAYMAADFSSFSMRTNPKAINSNLYNEISETDIRKELWDPTGENMEFPVPRDGNGVALGVRAPYMTRKFLTASGGESSIGDVPYMRAAEMYLIEAEALARMGEDENSATVLFDFVSARDPEYVQSTNTGDELIEEILIHRRVELWGEGFRFYDLKRLNMPLDRTGTNHQPSIAIVMEVPAGDEQWQFLIPQDEINNSNGIVTQNP